VLSPREEYHRECLRIVKSDPRWWRDTSLDITCSICHRYKPWIIEYEGEDEPRCPDCWNWMEDEDAQALPTIPRPDGLSFWEKKFDDTRNLFQYKVFCQHNIKEIRRRKDARGRDLFVHQCMRCGSDSLTELFVSKFIRYKDIPNRHLVKDFDKDLYERGAQLRKDEHLKAEEKRREAWRAVYNEYLDSPQWMSMRRAALQRDNGQCQRCLLGAQEVHHRHYHSIGNELLDDLVSLCYRCHTLTHEERRNA
jgi:5-methylcytosine-specific restriction endonuclease McrA